MDIRIKDEPNYSLYFIITIHLHLQILLISSLTSSLLLEKSLNEL